MPRDATYCKGATLTHWGYRLNYCSKGDICYKGECITEFNGRLCADRKSICPEKETCIDNNICMPEDAKDCHDGGGYCQYGFECAGNKKCSRSDSETIYLLLSVSNNGKFIGTGKDKNFDKAKTLAQITCEQQIANLASTDEERKETCRAFSGVSNACSALATSHDLVYGAPEKYSYGVGRALYRAQVSEDALAACKKAGGANCYVVPESVDCTYKGQIP